MMDSRESRETNVASSLPGLRRFPRYPLPEESEPMGRAGSWAMRVESQ